MANDKVQLFEDRPIRTAWVEDEEEWYFSVVDVVGTLTEQIDYEKARKYWNKLKQRLKEEGSQLVTNCHQLKMTAQDGKKRMTDVAKRFVDVTRRYGIMEGYIKGWEVAFSIKEYFEEQMGCSIYDVLPDIGKTTLLTPKPWSPPGK